jgi:subtilase family serine protease
MKTREFFGWAKPPIRGAFLAIARVTVLLVFATAAKATERQGLHGHVPAAVTELNLLPVGRLSSTNRLHLAIGLPFRNEEALGTLLQHLYDPTSPQYHQYLTPKQFTEMFGPTEQDYQAVIAFAKANGLAVTTTFPNRALVDVEGTAADIEKALHVTMRVYNHPKEARTFYAPNTEPSLDLSVPVLRIGGLDNYSLPHPNFVAKPMITAQATPNTGSGPSGSYLGNDFPAAYVPGSSLTGSGQIVGLVQFDGYYPADITYYETQAGLPNVTLTNVLVDNFDGTPSGEAGTIEVSLDIEMVISMAPGVSEVVVYETLYTSPWDDILHRVANDNLARQISCSWAGGAPDPSAEQAFLQMAAQGQSFFTASGDYGANTWPMSFPQDSTNITIVGGTVLTTSGPGGSWVSETTWSGSGGGISTYYSIPPWQQGVTMANNQGSTTKRNTPDVALTAVNVYERANGQDYFYPGTSIAAPLWAGFAALANQQAAANGEASIGFVNPAIYAIGTGPNYAPCFHDITTGSNTNRSSPNQFLAVSGYDLCTGWGTPNGTNLINALSPPPLTASFTASPTVGVAPLPVTFADASTGNITNWFWSFGDGAATNAPTPGMQHTYTTGGTYAVTETVTGFGGFSTATRANYITILGPTEASQFQAWLSQYFDCTNCVQALMGADADGTGQNNLFKYVAGLDPTNPASVFALNITSATSPPAQMNLIFSPVAAGRTYTPQFSTDLVNGVWSPLTTYTGPVTNDSNQVTITDTNPSPPQEFYRIDISLP